ITLVPRKTEKAAPVIFSSLQELLHQNILLVGTPLPIPVPGNSEPDVALIDLDMLHFPLELRPWIEGDHFQPLGMHGTQKVSDFLTQKKVDSSTRKNQQILADQLGIVWIVGHRIAHRVRITHGTKSALTIRKKN
ncbi:MAG: tRNA lysidine(34) synthetase TilS, partial [Flavobacteriales bacterium]|nr:tRNA lysidine(34) synthetase TilS [Flavobacteriales bacterium]